MVHHALVGERKHAGIVLDSQAFCEAYGPHVTQLLGIGNRLTSCNILWLAGDLEQQVLLNKAEKKNQPAPMGVLHSVLTAITAVPSLQRCWLLLMLISNTLTLCSAEHFI